MENNFIAKKVLITRQFDQSSTLINLLSNAGHYPFLLPMIETVQRFAEIEATRYDIIIFTSPNACKYFLQYNAKIKANLYIAVGATTAVAMSSYLNINTDKIPTTQSIEGIKDILHKLNLTDRKILMPGALIRSDFDDSEFVAMGAIFSYPSIYETIYTEYKKGYVDEFISANKIDTFTFCSPSAVKSFAGQVGIDFNDYDIISIGKTTADFLTSLGIKNRYPVHYAIEDMVSLI